MNKNDKGLLRNGLLNEGYHLKIDEELIDEMAYPSEFNPEEFKNLTSYSSKIKYAKDKLLGKLGSGSSRAVFKIDDEKVLKVALNNKGIAQNEAEAQGYKQNYDVIAKVFDVDDDYMWVEMELAKKISPKRFEQLSGMWFKELTDFLRMSRSLKPIFYLLTQERFDYYINNEDGWPRSLSDFVNDFNYPVPGDFAKISTYGEVLRNGEPTVVVIDFGATDDVLTTYYRRK